MWQPAITVTSSWLMQTAIPPCRKRPWKLAGFLLSHGEEYLTRGGKHHSADQGPLCLRYAEEQCPYSQVFIDDMARSHMIYYGENSAQIQTQIRNAVESVMLSGVSPEKALATLRASVQEIIDEQYKRF